MTHHGASSERRNDSAAGRDDLADGRDVAATGRDTTAHLRDVQAGDRDERAGRYVDDLHDRLTLIERQLRRRLTHLENTGVDPADWPELAEAGLARLRAHAAEQGRLAALDRAAICNLLDDLRTAIGDSRIDGTAAARDRRAAGHDRRAAAKDRADAAHDRDESAGDRDQADIERQQSDRADPADATPVADRPDGLDDSLPQQAARAVTDSRRRITDGRTYLTRGDGPVRPATASPPDAAPDADG
jgi:hypothetical protein